MDPQPPVNPPSTRRRLLRGLRYRFTVPQLHDDGSPILEEWHLRCETCDYDLTGLTSRICPECGKRFDPHATWRARRDKQAAKSLQTPAYIIYGALAILLLMGLRPIKSQPLILLPMLAIPAFEAMAFFLNKDAGHSRPIVVVFCIIATITWWSML